MKKISILGANGFIGSNTFNYLNQKGYDVTGFDLLEPSSFISEKNCNWIIGNFLNQTELEKAIIAQDIVCHFISTTFPGNSSDIIFDVESNVIGTLKVLDFCVKNKVKKVIFLSSGGTVYGETEKELISEDHPTNPINSYGITKLTIEKYLALYYKIYGLDYSILRVSNPFGLNQHNIGKQGFIGTLKYKIEKNELLEIWGDGTVIRDYIYVDDVVTAIEKSISIDHKSKIFNIGSGIGYSLNQIIEITEKIIGKEIKRLYSENRKIDVKKNALNITLAKTILKWEPEINLQQGLEKIFE